MSTMPAAAVDARSGPPVTLILGATGGIGAALAHRLAGASHRLVLAARSPEHLEALAGEVGGLAVPTDATRSGEVDGLVARALATHGRLDGVAHCVGSVLLKPAHQTSDPDWDAARFAGAAPLGPDRGSRTTSPRRSRSCSIRRTTGSPARCSESTAGWHGSGRPRGSERRDPRHRRGHDPAVTARSTHPAGADEQVGTDKETRTMVSAKHTTKMFAGLAVAAALVAGTPVAGHGADAPKDIVATAVAAGNFTTLAKALTAAGLVETLQGPGPFTVFAPTDAAFAKLPAGTLDALLEDKAKLTSVLTYHVVPGKVLAADVTKLSEAKTVQGQMVKISTSGGVKVDNANVVKTDIMASNGVIHVIDSVILPR